MTNLKYASGITVVDFLNHKITDGDFNCTSCGHAGQQRDGRLPATAPVLIKGRNYCLWCTFGIARELLEGASYDIR